MEEYTGVYTNFLKEKIIDEESIATKDIDRILKESKLCNTALLLSYLISIDKVPKKYEYGIILDDTMINYIDHVIPDDLKENILIISLSNTDFEKIARDIFSCKKIITTELYGIIFSNSLNVPVGWISIFNYVETKNNVSFHDYLSYYNITNPINLCNEIYLTSIDFTSIIYFDPVNVSMTKKTELLYTIINLFKSYGYKINKKFDNKIYDLNIGIETICDTIDKTNFLIGRIGGVEFDAYVDFKNNGFNPKSAYIRNLFKYCGYYDKDTSINVFNKYMEQMERYYSACDLILVGSNNLDSYYGFRCIDDLYYSSTYRSNTNVKNIINNDTLRIEHIPKISYHIFESFSYFKNYFTKLNGKKILIVSPFEREIRDQLKIKDKLFTGKNIIGDFTDFKYPEFASVEYINTYLTTNQHEMPHNNVLETFEYYKAQMASTNFDIALLICGAYAYLFGDYICNDLNKSCIHVGGIGQLFFGIKGGRYLTPFFESLMNENWIYPYTSISENAPGVPDCDGLLGYFKRK